MTDPDDVDCVYVEMVVHTDLHPNDPGWTLIRCDRCAAESSIPTHELPLDLGVLRPQRDSDGVRLALCHKCARPNRAERRRAR